MTRYPTYSDYANGTNGVQMAGDGSGVAYDDECCVGYNSRVENWAPGTSFHWIVSDGNAIVLDAYADVDLTGDCIISNMNGWSFCGLQLLWWVDFEFDIPVAGRRTGTWAIQTTEDGPEVDARTFYLEAAPECGNGITNHPNEDCDDGNTATETCGYGGAYSPIDPPGPDDQWCPVCDDTCLWAEGAHWCGDAVIDAADGETCDDGNISTATAAARYANLRRTAGTA